MNGQPTRIEQKAQIDNRPLQVTHVRRYLGDFLNKLPHVGVSEADVDRAESVCVKVYP